MYKIYYRDENEDQLAEYPESIKYVEYYSVENTVKKESEESESVFVIIVLLFLSSEKIFSLSSGFFNLPKSDMILIYQDSHQFLGFLATET